jgi:hypothetical protein
MLRHCEAEWDTVLPFGGSAIVGPSCRLGNGVAEEARTRSFAAPALARGAFVDPLRYRAQEPGFPWHAVLPASVKVLPATGTNLQR